MEEEEYIPGEKNIGKSEVRKRYLGGLAGFISFVVYFSIAYFLNWPSWTAAFSFAPLFFGYIGAIQGKMSFCAMFAVREVYEVSRAGGEKKKVESEENHEKDIKKARQIHLYTIILSIVTTLVAYLVIDILG